MTSAPYVSVQLFANVECLLINFAVGAGNGALRARLPQHRRARGSP